jgi:sarcosine oxidase/L-pipecolate oxidase
MNLCSFLALNNFYPLLFPIFKVNMSASAKKDYLLIGSGCFGASTALYLKRSYPTAKVTLIDRTPFPCPSAAAHDLNKIVRAEYEDPLYLKLGQEALKVWNSDPIFKPWFHQTGLVFASNAARGEAIIDNYKRFVGDSPTVMIEPEEAKSRFGGIWRDADWTSVSKCTYSPQAGWVDAEQALRSIIQAAVDLGVEYITATVSKVAFNDFGDCVGVQTSSGEYFEADRTVLCTGAYTAQLLADSAPQRKEIQVDGRMVAAAACMGLYSVPEDQMSKFANAPIIIFPEASYPGNLRRTDVEDSQLTGL